MFSDDVDEDIQKENLMKLVQNFKTDDDSSKNKNRITEHSNESHSFSKDSDEEEAQKYATEVRPSVDKD